MEPAWDEKDKAQPRAKAAGPAPINRVPRVLVVEDEHDIAGLIEHALERSGDARGTAGAQIETVVGLGYRFVE